MSFRTINNADFVVSGRNSATEFEPYRIGLENNFLVNWLSSSGFLTYIDLVAQAAGVVDTTLAPAVVTVITAVANANRTLTAADNGRTFLLPQATANNIITLPAVQAGLRFTFRHIAVPNAVNTWTIRSPAAGIIQGNLISTAAVGANIVSRTDLIASAVAANVNIGDVVELFCTGGSWHAIITSRVTAAYSFA